MWAETQTILIAIIGSQAFAEAIRLIRDTKSGSLAVRRMLARYRSWALSELEWHAENDVTTDGRPNDPEHKD